jgi:hypothetical protein
MLFQLIFGLILSAYAVMCQPRTSESQQWVIQQDQLLAASKRTELGTIRYEPIRFINATNSTNITAQVLRFQWNITGLTSRPKIIAAKPFELFRNGSLLAVTPMFPVLQSVSTLSMVIEVFSYHFIQQRFALALDCLLRSSEYGYGSIRGNATRVLGDKILLESTSSLDNPFQTSPISLNGTYESVNLLTSCELQLISQ